MEKQNNSVKFTLIIGLKLLIICGVVALLLAAINEFTSPVIKQKEAEEKQSAIQELFPDMTRSESADYSDDNTTAVYQIYQDDTLIGYCCDVSAQGFSDVIQMMVGIKAEDLSVIDTKIMAITDAPGKDKVTGDEHFLPQFNGTSGTQAFGSGVDAISGATYSSKGVLDCINAAAAAAENVAKSEVTGA